MHDLVLVDLLGTLVMPETVAYLAAVLWGKADIPVITLVLMQI